MKRYFLLGVLFLLLQSCTKKPDYESFTEFNDQNWHTDSLAVFNFRVSDAASAYRLGVHIRNTLDYPYSNLYFRYALLNDKGDTLRNALVEHYLLNPQSGKPLGKGAGSLFLCTFSLSDSLFFPQEGAYQVKIKQYMRADTLSGISAVGLQLKKRDTP